MRGHGGRLRLLLLAGSLLGNGLVAQSAAVDPQSSAMAEGQTADVADLRNTRGDNFGTVPPQRAGTILGAPASRQSAPPPTPGTTSVAPTAGEVLPSFDSLGAVQKGGRFFRLNCAPCHGATAHGGALVFAGMNAPSLMKVPYTAIPEFIRMGPGPMPAFKEAVFSDSDASAIAAYVHALQSARHPGGFSIGFLGPVTEGFFVIACGLGAAVLAAVWIEWKGRG